MGTILKSEHKKKNSDKKKKTDSTDSTLSTKQISLKNLLIQKQKEELRREENRYNRFN